MEGERKTSCDGIGKNFDGEVTVDMNFASAGGVGRQWTITVAFHRSWRACFEGTGHARATNRPFTS